MLSRYQHEPFKLLENMISTGLLCEFIDRFFSEYNEYQAWEMWLNKETGKTWDDFKLMVIEQEEISEDELQRANSLYERLCERGG